MSFSTPVKMESTRFEVHLRAHSKQKSFLKMGGDRRGTITIKEKVIQAVEDLPDDATIEDAMERLLFLAKIERGIQQADAGQTVPHSQVREKMAKWPK